MCFFFFSSRKRHTRCALVTGVQTCALPISWALYMLAECSHIQNAARAEVTEIAGNAPFAATMLKDMGAIRNIFRETLRLYPPVAFFPREEIGRASCRERVCQYV